MFPRQNQNQFRTAGADVQIFYGARGSSGTTNSSQRSWNKPIGVSHIYMMLIGGGSSGNGVDTGGGSGAVTVWYGAAQNVPDSLVVISSRGNSVDTTVSARFSNSALAPTVLLTAFTASGITGGVAMTANQFTASGFFQSVAGQDGPTGSLISASATTFLTGGGNSGGANPERTNYGYTTSNTTPSPGFFMLQPIIVGIGGVDSTTGGLGCGGGVSGAGGEGLVLIVSW